jgi:hypothetical protein
MIFLVLAGYLGWRPAAVTPPEPNTLVAGTRRVVPTEMEGTIERVTTSHGFHGSLMKDVSLVVCRHSRQVHTQAPVDAQRFFHIILRNYPFADPVNRVRKETTHAADFTSTGVDGQWEAP